VTVRKFGLEPIQAAWGILRVLATNVMVAMRTITVERGYDPREFTLVPFGGMGPTIAGLIAAELGIGRILIPRAPGTFSAHGMLVTDVHQERSRTRITPVDGAVPYDLLAERTDPSVVRLQLDTGNLAEAGRDPLEYLRRYGNRYWSFHIKDVPQLRATHDVDLGTGVIDFPRFIAAIDDLDHKLLFVEQESYPGTPLDSVRRDHAYMAALRY